ncbi:MAG: hypothetical protein MUE79_04675 [Nitratireductor sp.]|jgi:hypothetical protein|nr:hypothetical protein [Nitratireductor sp.]
MARAVLARLMPCAAILLALVFPLAGAFAQQPKPAAAKPPATRVFFEAKMTDTGAPLEAGVEWRVFSEKPGVDGKLALLSKATGGVQAFDIPPGEYFIHAAYGHAGAVRRIVVEGKGEQRETFTLNAGALQLSGITGTGSRIPLNLLRFDVYANEADERGVRQLIARNVKPNEIVPFPAGTYHVVSQFGTLNAEIRADLRVEAGKVTQATIEHRAARMTFRLVKTAGGDAIANTAWSILTESGDVITESVSAFPAFVLSEGTYTAIARNEEKIYSRDFQVISGINQDIELMAD